ncbi:MAG: EAL domain-containing protein, partial [Clostridiales bacterium]|nr:EAL domain-containing protein [Clostridiales bacterium]
IENHGNPDEGIFLQYQPILDLRTSGIVGFEALARLKSSKLGVVPPNEFIPLAEETQLINEIGKEVLSKVCSAISTVRSMGYDGIRFYVNISPIELLRNEFLEELTAIINLHGVSPENLGLEITESVFTESFDVINEKLGAVKEMGLHVAIDDFGTGYSSLARENELNVNCLKIDKSFIDKLMKIDPEKAVTSDIISMAHKLGHVVVAEGVEDDRQKQYLIENNCDMMQGFLFSKPIDFDTAIGLLQGTTSS